MFVCVCILVLFSILGINSQNVTADPSSLRFVNVIFRHGHRSPYRIYPKNPNRIDTWPQKTRLWLTPLGEETTRELGRYLRSRYDGFLNKTYYHDELKVWTSDTYRTIMSAYALLDGLYNTSTGPAIPVVSVGTRTEDNLIQLRKPCPKKDRMEYVNLNIGARANDTNKKYANLFRFLENETGTLPVQFGYPIFFLVDCLECEIAHGRPVPHWYNGTLRANLLDITDQIFGPFARQDEMDRLTGGPLLERCTQTMKSKQVSGIYEEKIHIYSAHEATLWGFLRAMDIFNNRRPPYASAVLMELHEISPNNYSIQILYRNESSHEAYPLTHLIKGCTSDMCPFETFVEGTKHGISDNWEQECGLLQETECSTKPNDTNRGSVTVCSIWLSVLALLLSVKAII